MEMKKIADRERERVSEEHIDKKETVRETVRKMADSNKRETHRHMQRERETNNQRERDRDGSEGSQVSDRK